MIVAAGGADLTEVGFVAVGLLHEMDPSLTLALMLPVAFHISGNETMFVGWEAIFALDADLVASHKDLPVAILLVDGVGHVTWTPVVADHEAEACFGAGDVEELSDAVDGAGDEDRGVPGFLVHWVVDNLAICVGSGAA